MVKPEEKFKALIPMEPELVKIVKDKEQFFYFEVDS